MNYNFVLNKVQIESTVDKAVECIGKSNENPF
jgi:hypothetical protein